jgi:hypothetical protein
MDRLPNLLVEFALVGQCVIFEGGTLLRSQTEEHLPQKRKHCPDRATGGC